MYTADYIIYFINAQHILNSLKNAKKITQTPYKFSILSFFQNTTLLLYFVPFLVRFHIYKPDFCPHHHLSIFQLSSCYDFNHHFFFWVDLLFHCIHLPNLYFQNIHVPLNFQQSIYLLDFGVVIV